MAGAPITINSMIRSPPIVRGGLRQSSTAAADVAIVNRSSFQNRRNHSFTSTLRSGWKPENEKIRLKHTMAMNKPASIVQTTRSRRRRNR